MRRHKPRFHLLQLAALGCIASLLLAPPAMAKQAEDGGGGWWRSRPNPNGGHGKGVPAVLRKLEEMQNQLESSNAETQRRLSANAEQIAALQAQLQELDQNVVPCTLDRYRDGLCGPDNHPLDLEVTVCAGVGANAGLAISYAFTSELSGQIGIGWKDSLDVDITENVAFPAVIPLGVGPLVFPVVLPSELAAQAEASANLGIDGCLAPIRVAVGKYMAADKVLEILEAIDAQAQPIVDTLTAQLLPSQSSSAGMVTASGAGLGLSTISDALAAADQLRNHAIMDDDPIAAFGRGPIANLAAKLPVGDRLSAILDDPGQLALPGFGGSSSGASAATAIAPAPEMVFNNVCNGPLGARLGPICNTVAILPTGQEVLALIPAIQGIPNLVGDVIAGVTGVLDSVLVGVGETVQTAKDRFCATAVGQRRVFDLFCGR